MNEAEKSGFVRQAQSELQQRIAQTNKICDQLKNSYSGYSSNIAQISLLVVLGFIISMIIWATFNVDIFLNIFSTQNYDRDSLLAKMALMSMCLYIALHICKKITCILRIAKIDGHISNVRNIEKYLQRKLNNIGSIAADADKLIFGDVNKKIEPEYDVDADIAKYSGLVKTYSNLDNNWFSITLTIMHWFSGVLFISVFLLISTPFSAEKFNEWTKIKESDLIALAYIAFFLLLYMILQELFARNIIASLHTKIKKLFGILFMAGICGIIFYLFFLPENFALINKLKYDTPTNYVLEIVISYVPLLIGVVFSSIICLLCKIENTKLNIFYIIVIYGILLLYSINFNSFSIGCYVNFMEAIFTLCIPITAAAFCTSIISIISKIKNKTFGFILIGISAAYILTIIISIGNNITEYAVFTNFIEIFEGIRGVIHVLLLIAGAIIVIYFIFSGGLGGGIIIVVICAIIYYFITKYLGYVLTGIIIFALTALIPLLPSLILLFITSRANSRSSRPLHITMVLMLAAVCAAGFSIKKSDGNYSLPPAPVQTATEKKVTVIPDALNLRAEPSGNAGIIKILYKGNVLTVTGDVSGGWTPVEHEGARGWVSSEFIK